jgi:VanZ family protein
MKKKKQLPISSRSKTFDIIFTSLLPLVAWMTIIFLLSARERVALTDSYALSFVVFKTAHLVEYAILYSLWFRLFTKMEIGRPYLLAFICTVAYAASDEFHQTLVPTREGRVRDVVIDTIGASIAYFGISSISFVRKRLTS